MRKSDPEMFTSGEARQAAIIRTIRHQFVPERLADFSVDHQEDSRHSLYIACRRTNPMPVQPGHHHARQAFRVDVLPPVGAH